MESLKDNKYFDILVINLCSKIAKLQQFKKYDYKCSDWALMG